MFEAHNWCNDINKKNEIDFRAVVEGKVPLVLEKVRLKGFSLKSDLVLTIIGPSSLIWVDLEKDFSIYLFHGIFFRIIARPHHPVMPARHRAAPNTPAKAKAGVMPLYPARTNTATSPPTIACT